MITEDALSSLTLDMDVAAEVWLQHLNFVNVQPAKFRLDVLDATNFVATTDRNSVVMTFGCNEQIKSWLPNNWSRPGGSIYLTIAQADALREHLSLIVDLAWTDDDEDLSSGVEMTSPTYKAGGETVPDLLGHIASALEARGAADLFQLPEGRVREAAIACRLAQEALNNLSVQETPA